MTPPRAEPVTAALRRWLDRDLLPPGAPLVIACSGGADSLALAIAAREVVDGGRLAAAVIDHRLQPGSAEVAERAAGALRDLGYRRVDVRAVTVDGAGGMEAAARAARYRALREIAAARGPDTAVLLAHTADDQAETVLLGLARGSGPRSVAGMRDWRPPWGRPLLTVRRADTERLCRDRGVSYWHDPQNDDVAFTRVRLRREVLPLLERTLGGGVAPALARTAELMADDLAALDEIADRARAAAAIPAPAGPPGLSCAALRDWPSAVRRRVLRGWLATADVTELTYRHLVRLEGLVMDGRTGAAVRLPGGADVVRRGPELRLEGPTPR